MSIRKKFLAGLLVAVSAAACAFGAFGCSGSNNTNKEPEYKPPVIDEGSFETSWTNDNDYHWHAATDGSDNVDGKAMHDWVEQTDKSVAASCTAAGHKDYKCSVCNAEKSQPVAQLSHVWSDTKTVAATCTTRGYEYKECTNAGCTETTRGKDIPALGHLASDATCTTASVCTREGCSVTVAPATGHDYVLSSQTAATCTKEGKQIYACSHKGCEESYETVVSAPTGHTVVWDNGTRNSVHTADVCYEIVYEGHCEHCEYSERKTTQVAEHVFSGRITKEATCKEKGEKTLTCECSYIKTEEIAVIADAHKWDGGTTVDGVTTFCCTENPEHIKQSVVYAEKQAEVPVSTLTQTNEVKLADTTISLDDAVKNTIKGNEKVNLSADTLTKDDLGDLGANYNYIKSDATVYNLTLEAGGQFISQLGGYVTVTVPYELGADEDPDHIVIWYVEGKELAEIEGTYANGFVTFRTNHFSYYTVTRMTTYERCAKFGHVYTSYTIEPTCLTAGYEFTFCTRCGTGDKVDLPAKGHDWESTTEAAACTTAGVRHYGCTREGCGVKYDVKLPATGHEWVAAEYKEATCTAEGNATYHCENCSETYTVKLTQTAHAFKTTVVAATCTEGGHKHNVCLTCGLENDTDHVAALGHQSATKVVAPACEVDGFTLNYCTVCGEELSKTNVVKATGHNMVNGTCSVCGHGCDHKYVPGERVEATCTEDGYILFTCDKCNNSYKGEIVNATGHHFNVDECPDCGTPNPAARDYYLNFVDTSLSGSVSITLTDLTYKVQSNTYENGELVNEYEVTLKQLDITVISFGISPTGEIKGSGYGSASLTMPVSEDASETVTVSCKIAVTDSEMYVAIQSDKAQYVPSMYITMSLDYVLGSATNKMLDTATLREYIRWYNTSVNPILNNLINTNSDLAADAIKKVMNNLFVRTEVEGGYNYLLDFEAAAKLNETLYTTKVSEVVDKVLFKGAYELIPDFVSIVLNLNPEKAIEYAAKFGLDKDAVCAAIDSFMFIMTGEKFDSAAMLDAYLNADDGALKKTTVADLIIAQAGLEVTKEEFIKQADEQVKAMLGQYKDATVYEAVAPFVGEGATAESLYDMVNGMIYRYVGQASNMVNVSFTTDKRGKIVSAKLDLDIINLPVSGDNGGDVDVPSNPSEKPDYPYEERSSYRYESILTLNGSIDFAFGAEVVIDSKLISDIKAAKPVFEKNAVITAYADTEVINDQYTGEVLPEKNLHTRSTAMTVHTDSKGNIVKVVRTEEEVYRYVSGTFGNFYYCSESVHTDVTEYDIVNGSMSMITKGYCGAYDSYTLSSVYTQSSQYVYYERTYRLQTDELVKDVIIKREPYDYGTRNGTVTVYYNSETKQFKAQDPHASGYLKLDERKSKIECGGYYYFCCEDCDYHYERSIYHLGDWNRNEQYKLAEGAKSCEDGVLRLYVCPVCEEVVHSETLDWHVTYKIGEIDLTKYGAGCGHTIDVHGCACGYYLGTLIRDEYYGKEEFGNNCESFMPEGYYDYNGKEVFVYSCFVSDCGFNFAFYTDSTKDDKCWASCYQHLLLGVKVDEKTRTISGGTAYDKFENKPLEYTHKWQHNSKITTTETANGYVEEYKCADCGLKVSKEEHYVVENSATHTTVITDINTTYKNDVDDNTEKSVTKRVETNVYDANGKRLKYKYEYSYYDGAIDDKNLSSRDINVTTYEYDENGKRIKSVMEFTGYSGNGNIRAYQKSEYDVVWVGDWSYEFETERYEAYDYYDEKGEPCETPMRWERRVYDYSEGYCSPVIYTSTQAGESQPYPGRVEHSPMGELVSQPTCTQYGTSLCAFCGKEMQCVEPRGHWYYEGKCEYCGLENPNQIDGMVVLEDLSYTSETNYVIGYFNRESSSYSFSVALVDLDKEGEDNVNYIPNFGYTDSNENAVEINYYRSGTVSFAKAAVNAAAEKLGITNYMIRVTYVPEKHFDKFDYSITIDAHEWTEAEATVITYGEGEPTETTVTIKYCAECGMLHGAGYLKWNAVSAEDGEYIYQADKNNKFYQFKGYIQGIDFKNGEVVLGKTFRLVGGYANEVNFDEETIAGTTLVFNDFETGNLNGTAFTYGLYSARDGWIESENGLSGCWVLEGEHLRISFLQYDKETAYQTETLYIFELA